MRSIFVNKENNLLLKMMMAKCIILSRIPSRVSRLKKIQMTILKTYLIALEVTYPLILDLSLRRKGGQKSHNLAQTRYIMRFRRPQSTIQRDGDFKVYQNISGSNLDFGSLKMKNYIGSKENSAQRIVKASLTTQTLQ